MVLSVYNRKKLRRELLGFQPDIVYLRQMLWWPGLCGCLEGFQVVQEINSDIETEYNLLRGFHRIKKVLYNYSQSYVAEVTAGVVSVSTELLEKYGGVESKACVIGNGYDFSFERSLSTNENIRPQLIFVGSKEQGWSGIDKLIKMAELLPEMDFHFVGAYLSGCDSINFQSYGFMVGGKLEKLYQKMDFGIGTLALHRKSMEEASPLKVREYVAYGLPVIAGYVDTDLEGVPYFLNIGNYENNVYDSVDKIREFVKYWFKNGFPYKDAELRLSYKSKEKLRLQFFKEVLDG
jgi:hypothetical protein